MAELGPGRFAGAELAGPAWWLPTTAGNCLLGPGLACMALLPVLRKTQPFCKDGLSRLSKLESDKYLGVFFS